MTLLLTGLVLHYIKELFEITMKGYTAEQLVKLITDAYTSQRGVFRSLVNAENLIPEEADSLEKAEFLFYVIQLDYAMQSRVLYKRAQDLWARAKHLFTAHYVCRLNKYALHMMIEGHLRPRYPNEAYLRWRNNSKILLNEYRADPRNIFAESTDALKIIEKIHRFRGFGPKIGNFFFRAMVNTFNFPLENIEEVTPPVDIHDVRLTADWGLIPEPIMSQKRIKEVKQIWQNACKQCKISGLQVDRALWILGSEGHRTGNPQHDLETNLQLK